MSETKWTQGPWAVRRGKSGLVWAVEPVTKWNGLARKGQNVEANAQLIASAPEMYEALEAILPYIPTLGAAAAYSSYEIAADKVRAALAKARGETP